MNKCVQIRKTHVKMLLCASNLTFLEKTASILTFADIFRSPWKGAGTTTRPSTYAQQYNIDADKLPCLEWDSVPR